MSRPSSQTKTRLIQVEGASVAERPDVLATEEPLEIRLLAGSQRATVAVTMRTPGNDFELALGFLFSESVVSSDEDIHGVSYCVDRALDEDQLYNVVNVRLRADRLPELARLERHFLTSSACGVCGRASIESLADRCRPVGRGSQVDRDVVADLPGKLSSAQRVFGATGGLHAAALFDRGGDLLEIREDVGRHNAVDKLVGWGLMQRALPLEQSVALVSGRASYEIVQKFVAAGIPLVCAVSAPSSLAVRLADEFGVTLVGFLRGERFNVYTHPERIAGL